MARQIAPRSRSPIELVNLSQSQTSALNASQSKHPVAGVAQPRLTTSLGSNCPSQKSQIEAASEGKSTNYFERQCADPLSNALWQFWLAR